MPHHTLYDSVSFLQSSKSQSSSYSNMAGVYSFLHPSHMGIPRCRIHPKELLLCQSWTPINLCLNAGLCLVGSQYSGSGVRSTTLPQASGGAGKLRQSSPGARTDYETIGPSGGYCTMSVWALELSTLLDNLRAQTACFEDVTKRKPPWRLQTSMQRLLFSLVSLHILEGFLTGLLEYF